MKNIFRKSDKQVIDYERVTLSYLPETGGVGIGGMGSYNSGVFWKFEKKLI